MASSSSSSSILSTPIPTLASMIWNMILPKFLIVVSKFKFKGYSKLKYDELKHFMNILFYKNRLLKGWSWTDLGHQHWAMKELVELSQTRRENWAKGGICFGHTVVSLSPDDLIVDSSEFPYLSIPYVPGVCITSVKVGIDHIDVTDKLFPTIKVIITATWEKISPSSKKIENQSLHYVANLFYSTEYRNLPYEVADGGCGFVMRFPIEYRYEISKKSKRFFYKTKDYLRENFIEKCASDIGVESEYYALHFHVQ